jgi:hypothetical protein
MNFLSVKGFGDFVVLAYILRYVTFDYSVYVRSPLFELAKMLIQDDKKVYELSDLINIPSIYNVRRDFSNLLCSSFLYRRSINFHITNQLPILIDDKLIRNQILFLGLNTLYLKKMDNIYSSYASTLNIQLPKFSIKESGFRKAVFFPFGSNEMKKLPIVTVYSIYRALKLFFDEVYVIIYNADVNRIINNNIPFISYDSPQNLRDILSDSNFTVSVDTFQLHLSAFYNIPTHVVGPFDAYFIPPFILSHSNNSYFEVRRAIDRIMSPI